MTSWTALERSRRGCCLCWSRRWPRRKPPAGSQKTRGMVSFLFHVLLCILVVLSVAVWLTVTHLFTVNVAFTAQECYQRIDRRLRATLRRKQIPMVSAVSKRIVSDHIGWMGQDWYLVGVCERMRVTGGFDILTRLYSLLSCFLLLD